MRVQLNKDKQKVKEIRNLIKANEGYCPCSLVKAPDTRCMCKNFKRQIEAKEVGFCHCGLYELIMDD